MNKTKKIIIGILLLTIISLFGYGVYYLVTNTEDDNIVKTDIKYTPSNAHLVDKLEQPELNIKVTNDTLPEFTDTLTSINFKTFKKLFSTSKRSILVLVNDGCSYCEEFKPNIKNALERIHAKVYMIDLSTLKENENIKEYIYYRGTPTTYIIENGKVTHTFNGSTDYETILAFLDLYYLR